MQVSEETIPGQPPIAYVDRLLCLLESDRHSIEVVLPIHIPLDIVTRSFGSEGFESMGLGDLGSLVVGLLLVFLVMSVIRVDLIVVSVCSGSQ